MKTGEKGQALIEFALLSSFLILLVMAVLAFGLILTNEISLYSTANLAARTAANNDQRKDYCADLGGHLNSPTYDAVINNLGGLPVANIRDIIIFKPTSDGHIDSGAVDVVLANGSEASGCYDYNHDGSCSCGGSGCADDLFVHTLPNSLRCPAGTSIGVEIRYNQTVPVPIISAITGDVIVLPARIIMIIED